MLTTVVTVAELYAEDKNKRFWVSLCRSNALTGQEGFVSF